MKQEDCKFMSFSFPQHKREQIAESLKRSGAEPSISKHRRLERHIYAQESRGETLFNELSRYKLLFEQREHSSRSRSRKSVSPRSSVLKKSVSPLREEPEESESAETDQEYVYQSPKEMIRNLNEQMDRNKGRYGSLLEFAQQNGLNVKDRVFANCEESGDVLEPKIDLEKGLEEALMATSLE